MRDCAAELLTGPISGTVSMLDSEQRTRCALQLIRGGLQALGGIHLERPLAACDPSPLAQSIVEAAQGLVGVLPAAAEVVIEAWTFGERDPQLIGPPQAAYLPAERQRRLSGYPRLGESAERCHSLEC
jgi:hypothetical protein